MATKEDENKRKKRGREQEKTNTNMARRTLFACRIETARGAERHPASGRVNEIPSLVAMVLTVTRVRLERGRVRASDEGGGGS